MPAHVLLTHTPTPTSRGPAGLGSIYSFSVGKGSPSQGNVAEAGFEPGLAAHGFQMGGAAGGRGRTAEATTGVLGLESTSP